MKTLAVLNSSAPFGNDNFRESIDLLLANASYDRPVALFFYGDGLYQLIPNQQPVQVDAKDISKMFGLLDLYDIEDIFICQHSLQERHLDAGSLIIDGQVLNSVDWLAKLSQYDQVVSF
ncbi:MAG: sulfurtransferase complex subunit TusC [Gammaproteobacteria bacterium]|nr:sulfurtransferase complex subunit TusC [Gammaproteobacteria bacterium]